MQKLLIFTLIFSFLTACDTSGLKSDLTIIEDIALPIAEPSGITSINNKLLIVSDSNGVIYTTDLEGKLLNKQQTSFQDLEGVTATNSKTIAVVDEEGRQLAIVNRATTEKFRIKGENQNNNGLEGIAYNPLNKTFWIVQEKYPVKIININSLGTILDEYIIDFTSDLSGICFDKNSNSLWAISDENQNIFQISLEGKLLNSYKIPVFKAEGITIVNNRIYVVSDAYSKLYIFKMPKLQ